MPRPPKCRKVEFIPRHTYFKPAGIPLVLLEEVSLTVEEVEAIRLKDLEGNEQEACAERMEVSRPTFHRILESARKKIAEALIQGKAIRVEGGTFKIKDRSVRCNACGHIWKTPVYDGLDEHACPRCSSTDIDLETPEGN